MNKLKAAVIVSGLIKIGGASSLVEIDEDYYSEAVSAVQGTWGTIILTVAALIAGYAIGRRPEVKGDVRQEAEVYVDVGAQTDSVPAQAEIPIAPTVPPPVQQQQVPSMQTAAIWHCTHFGTKWHVTMACRALKDVAPGNITSRVLVPMLAERCKICCGR